MEGFATVLATDILQNVLEVVSNNSPDFMKNLVVDELGNVVKSLDNDLGDERHGVATGEDVVNTEYTSALPFLSVEDIVSGNGKYCVLS